MKNEINAWLIGSKYYVPCFVLGLINLAFGLYYDKYLFSILGVILGLLALFILTFFRDFERSITAEELEIVSPADGTVVELQEVENEEYLLGKATKISIFMSVFNAHVNRAPYDGTVKKVVYKKGKFLNAMKESSAQENESNTIYLSTSKGDLTIRQIAGLIARRIVCPLKEGDQLKKGQKFGMIMFGSRVEIYLPAQNVKVYVTKGDKVYAGLTILGSFKD